MRLLQRMPDILQTVILFAVFLLNTAALLTHVFVSHHAGQIVRKLLRQTAFGLNPAAKLFNPVGIIKLIERAGENQLRNALIEAVRDGADTAVVYCGHAMAKAGRQIDLLSD